MPDPPPSALFVYSPTYSIARLGDEERRRYAASTPFPFTKYEKLWEALVAAGEPAASFASTRRASWRELRLIHTRLYLDILRFLAATRLGSRMGENLFTPVHLDFARAACLGTYLAARIALGRGAGMNLSGGFHHAFPGHFEGFCHLNDVAVAVALLRLEGRIRRAMIVDLDVHQGNGNAHIFRGDPETHIVDVYQVNNYPGPAFVPVTTPVPLDPRVRPVTDDLYLDALRIMPAAIDRFEPEIIFYLAGADPYGEDRLGGFGLTMEGLRRRDSYVIEEARKRGVPVVVGLAGGYPRSIDDLVAIHLATARSIVAAARPGDLPFGHDG